MQFSGDGFSFPLGEKTYIMGIVNVTPDSFSGRGRYLDPERRWPMLCACNRKGRI